LFTVVFSAAAGSSCGRVGQPFLHDVADVPASADLISHPDDAPEGLGDAPAPDDAGVDSGGPHSTEDRGSSEDLAETDVPTTATDTEGATDAESSPADPGSPGGPCGESHVYYIELVAPPKVAYVRAMPQVTIEARLQRVDEDVIDKREVEDLQIVMALLLEGSEVLRLSPEKPGWSLRYDWFPEHRDAPRRASVAAEMYVRGARACEVVGDITIEAVVLPDCGDGVCVPAEFTARDCVEDCGACDDGNCDAPLENVGNCMVDCLPGARCGDGICLWGREHMGSCPADCHTAGCGDGYCDAEGELGTPEDPDLCINDCPSVCGDCLCHGPGGENGETCAHDCSWACGNQVAEPCDYVHTERFLGGDTCWFDCRQDICFCEGGFGAGCGDGCCMGYICQETPETCPVDCLPPCGNGYCEPPETVQSCPEDCKTWACGDGECDPAHENSVSCPTDCGSICGNGSCEPGESFGNCPYDCGGCGDGHCSLVGGEGGGRCVTDCRCGDGTCDPTADETPESCIEDCHCGNGRCEQHRGETDFNCPGDCRCGNGVCESWLGENPKTCPIDCACGDGFCDFSRFENELFCYEDCHCGDGRCEEPLESPESCPEDCVDVCGNCICEAGEDDGSCPFDCAVCGDGVCAECAGEDAGSCNVDCSCGNGVCDAGEDGASCPADCCVCGDCRCDPACGEEEESCAEDCDSVCGDRVLDRCDVVKTEAYLAGDPHGQDCRMDICTCLDHQSGTISAGCGDGCCVGWLCGETPETCPGDCTTICGNRLCERLEDRHSCPEDCTSPVCGNNFCEFPHENPESCPYDCTGKCGNFRCERDENMVRCPQDCGFCGDGVCVTGRGETPGSCAMDCGYCGDGFCAAIAYGRTPPGRPPGIYEVETVHNCKQDCPERR
jgi:hypothetical protein